MYHEKYLSHAWLPIYIGRKCICLPIPSSIPFIPSHLPYLLHPLRSPSDSLGSGNRIICSGVVNASTPIAVNITLKVGYGLTRVYSFEGVSPPAPDGYNGTVAAVPATTPAPANASTAASAIPVAVNSTALINAGEAAPAISNQTNSSANPATGTTAATTANGTTAAQNQTLSPIVLSTVNQTSGSAPAALPTVNQASTTAAQAAVSTVRHSSQSALTGGNPAEGLIIRQEESGVGLEGGAEGTTAASGEGGPRGKRRRRRTRPGAGGGPRKEGPGGFEGPDEGSDEFKPRPGGGFEGTGTGTTAIGAAVARAVEGDTGKGGGAPVAATEEGGDGPDGSAPKVQIPVIEGPTGSEWEEGSIRASDVW